MSAHPVTVRNIVESVEPTSAANGDAVLPRLDKRVECDAPSAPNIDDEAVAATRGRLSAAAIRRGRPRPVNDMWIAACCLTHGITLATLNLKDYEDFNQHRGLRILGRE